MPVISSDAVLWYNVGDFGRFGYGVPNWSDDIGSLNPQILDFTRLVGKNLFAILHHEDVDSTAPPSINTLHRLHKLYVRVGQILKGRAVPDGELRMEALHNQPAGDVFTVYPVPFFKIRNAYLKRWAGWVLMAIAEAMQHTENRQTLEISTRFSGDVGKYFRRYYANMAVELFGKPREEALADGFLLTDADLSGYNPGQWFTPTELVDTVPPLDRVFTEDRLRVLAEGIPVSALPPLQPWPLNLQSYYQRLNAERRTASDDAADSDDAATTEASAPNLGQSSSIVIPGTERNRDFTG